MALTKTAVKARREFRSVYSPDTAKIIQLLARGLTSAEVAERVGSSVASVATTKGNLTRGWYAPFAVVDADGAVTGECRF